jgi:carboxyl-terminal processing protease
MKSSPMKMKWAAALAFAALAAGCGGGGEGGGAGDPSSPASCSVADQRTWLRAYMEDRYFWSANLRSPDTGAATMDAYFRSMLFNPPDRYSYSQSTASFNQFFNEGERTGFGYSLGWADAAQTILKVLYVEPLSPVAAAGLLRGETIESIDGYTPVQVAGGSLPSVTTAGVNRTFTVRDAANVQRTFSATSANFALSPVLARNTFDVATAGGNVKAGYLMFQEFINAGSAPLATAFDEFRAAGVTELVVDMRYNGGGSLTVARNLGSLIGGGTVNGRTFAQLRFNEKHAAENFTYSFNSAVAPTTPLSGLTRVFVITSPSTASASEVLINSLKPFMTVVQIGGTTFGKPYGFQPREACGTTYNAVNFDTVNAAGVGGYSNGLAAACTVADDLTKQFGDATEGRTAAAISYIQTGGCPPVIMAPASAGAVQVSGPLAGEGSKPGMFAD